MSQIERNCYAVSSLDAIVVIAGGKDGYVGRDGQAAGGKVGDGPPGAA